MSVKGRIGWLQCLVCLLLSALPNVLSGQLPWFRLYGKEYGLSQSQANALARDSSGRIWLASDQGLQCFDGHGFQQVLPAIDSGSGIRSGPVTSLHVDSRNRLWIGYYHSGVSVWDLGNGAIVHFDPGAGRSKRVLHIQAGPPGKVWVFLHDTVWLSFEEAGMAMQTMRPQFARGTTPLFLRFAVPAFQPNQWILGSNRGLYRADLLSGKTTHHPYTEPDGSRPGVRNMVNALMSDGNRIWVASWGGGLLAFDLIQLQYTGAYTYQDVPELSGATNVIHRLEAMGDKILVTTPDRGMGVFDPANGSYAFTGPASENLGGLSLAYAICRGDHGAYWIGHQAGLMLYDPARQFMRQFPIPATPDPAMKRLNFPLDLLPEGNILYTASAHGSGVYAVEAGSGKLLREYALPGLRGSMMVWQIEPETEGRLLVNAREGLFSLETGSGRWKPFLLPDGRQAFCRSIRRHGDSLLLGFADGRIGLYRFGNKSWRIWGGSDFKAGGLTFWPGPVLDICADARGAVYASNEKGITVITPGAAQLRHLGFEQGQAWRLLRIVNWLEPTPDGKIWFSGEEGGLAAIDPANGDRIVQHISEADGLQERFVASPKADKQGRVWALSGSSLFCYDPRDRQLRQWTGRNGLVVEPAEWSRLHIAGDELFFSVLNGWNRLSMAALPKAEAPARPMVAAWRKAGESWQLQAAPQLQAIADAGGAIRLAVQPITDAEHTQYRYRFGSDMPWINAEGDRQILLGSMAPGEYRLEVSVRNLNHGWTHPLPLGQFRVLPPFYRRAWFLIAVLFLVIGLLSWYFIARQQRRQLASGYEKRVMQLQAEALRSQMNPHFLFNSLNSIRYYIEQNDRDRAAHYLQRFSKLMRAVLNHARSETVSLEEELAVVQLYTELEQMRFQKVFAVEVYIDPTCDPALVRVPPMLLQPYVENAIWHGLMHRDDGGVLRIHISGNTASTLVEIDDNGIGRERAAGLKSKSASGDKSHGTRITQERIEVHNRLGNSRIRVETTDLPMEAGGGTRVALHIDYPSQTEG